MQSDRVMIERFVGAYAAGIYSAVSTVASILMIVGNAVDSIWAPWSYRTISDGQIQKVKFVSTYYYLVYACISVGFGMIAPEITRLFTLREDYWVFSWLVYPMVLMQFIYFTSKIPANLLFYYKKTSYSAGGILFSAILNIILNYLGFKGFGFEVAAFTSLFCVAIFTVLQLLWCRHFKMNIYDEKKILLISIGTIMIILIEFYSLSNIIIRYSAGCLMIMLILIVFIRKFDLMDYISK